MAAVQLRVLGTSEQRFSARRPVGRTSTLRHASALPLDVIVADFSQAGCQLICAGELSLGASVTVGLAGSGLAKGHIVRRIGSTYGCAFDPVLTPEQMAEAFGAEGLVALPRAPWAVCEPAPEIDRWSASTRLVILGGAASIAWALVAALVVLI